jgi:hypothetical protein
VNIVDHLDHAVLRVEEDDHEHLVLLAGEPQAQEVAHHGRRGEHHAGVAHVALQNRHRLFHDFLFGLAELH